MPICKFCDHEELEGALFCSECGSQLFTSQEAISEFDDETLSNSLDKSQVAPGDYINTLPPPTLSEDDADITLYIVNANEFIPLENSNQFTIGRVALDQPIIPDIDLSPFEGYEFGVSRIHATIYIDERNITIEDHNSANGSSVNKTRLSPNKPYLLAHGDMITLGQFNIQILIRE